MPGLVPGIHGFNAEPQQNVEGRNKSGHDACGGLTGN
jgi:hypothetical protein